MRYRIYDTDHPYPALGGEPSEFDHLIVYDTQKTEVNPLTGKTQATPIFAGTRTEVYQWLREHE